MDAAIAGDVLRRGQRMVFMHAVGVAIVIVMMALALEMHEGVLLLLVVGHHHGDASMGQRLPVHAEHQDEGGETTTHGRQSS